MRVRGKRDAVRGFGGEWEVVNRQWKKMGMLAALLVGVAGAAAPEPVLVRFEKLYWVGAKTVLPYSSGGQTYVPPIEACDLLGLSCTLGKETLNVGGQTLPLVPVIVLETTGRRTLTVTAFAPLVKLAGQNLVWDAANKTATVSGGSGSKGWRYALDYVGQPPNVYAGALQTSRAAPQYGKPSVSQTVFSKLPLQDLSYFSKSASSLNIVGSQAPSSADVPNTFPGCGGKTSCTLPVPRDALWTLALVTAQP